MNSDIQRVVTEYRKSTIQSESEVRSKFIVPLLDVLGYPSYLRAEEFPVYGFGGSKKLPTKSADFLLFSDADFAKHRRFTKKDLEWVQEHSLLVVEAKKPGNMPEISGQPIFYSAWTRAIAYLITDGERIKGSFYNPISADHEVIDCSVDDLSKYDKIQYFSYKNTIEIKNRGVKYSQIPCFDLYGGILEQQEVEHIPPAVLSFMREALGKNAEGITDIQLVSRFIDTTNALLRNEMRYGIPEYMFQFPRDFCEARLYVDEMVLPLDCGEVSVFFWNEYDRFAFESDCIQVIIDYKDGKLIDFGLGYHVQNNRVIERLKEFERVKRILAAKTLKVVLDDIDHRVFTLPSGDPQEMWRSKAYDLGMCDFWCKGLEQLRTIEEFYEIEFDLKKVEGEKELNELYDAISFVYDGIVMNENCEITLPGGVVDEDIQIIIPELLEEREDLPLLPKIIHGICFIPYQSWLLPGTIAWKGTNKEDIVKHPGCCRYKIVEALG